MTGTGVLRGRGSRIGTALFLALLTVFSVLSPIPFNQSVARGQTVVTFTVDSADCGEANFCTVYEAITEALGSTDPVTVEVLPGADAGVYGFFQVPEAGFPQGLTVVGIGDDPTITIRSVISDPVVWVRPGNVVTLENLTLEQTSIERVIENSADLTLNGVVVTGGTYGGDGGGIYNDGVLVVQAGSQVTGNTAGLFGPGLVDQENESTSGTTGSGASLLQGFTPAFDTLKRVELEFRADGGYAGSTQTVRIHPVVDGTPDLLSPLGEVQRFVPSTEIAGGASAFIPFEFSPPLNLIPDQQYAIEWGGGSVSWYFSNTAYPPADPYDRGISWSNSGGGLTATPDRDFHFRTYWADIDESGNGGGIFNDGGEVFILNSTVGGNAAVGGEFGENGRGGGVHNANDGELTVDASSVSDNTAFQFSVTETGFPNSYGGGIYNNGGIADVINNSSISGNSANNGGGIYNLFGTLNATDSSVSDNTAWNVGGGLVEAAPTTTNLNNVTVSGNSAYEGGGIYVDYGTLNATLTTVSGNTAESGGGIYNEWGTVTFADGTVDGNTARSGGGIFNDFGTIDLADSAIGPDNLATDGGGGGLYSYGGSLELTNTGVDGNEAYGDGGGVYLSGGWPGYDGTMTMLGGSLSNNQAFEYECEGPCPALGGGLANYYGLTQLTQVAVTGNTVYGYGGGVSNGYNATTVISESDVSGNTVYAADSYDPGGSGGGVFSYGVLTVDSTTISGNLADLNGGGIAACDSDPVSIVNSTISGNSAPTGGGISTDGCYSDYLPPESSGTQLNNVTVTDNTAFDSAGGIENMSAPLSLSNTIVAANEVDNDGVFPSDCVSGVPATGDGFNLIGAGGCGLTDGVGGNQVGTPTTPLDPGLATLADNGGPTLTHALEADSPAIDAGDPGDSIESIPSTCEATDQRGIPRPQGAACDIGAFELDEIDPATLGEVTFSADSTEVEAGAAAVPIDVIPLSLFTESDGGPEGAPLSAIPLSAIGLKGSPLSAIPLSAIPLSAIATLTGVPLSAILLSDIPLSAIGGWDDLLVGTDLDGAIPQNTTLQDVLALPEPQRSDVLDEINIGDSEIASTLLAEVDIFEFLFANSGLLLSSPLSAIGSSPDASPLSAIPLSAIPLSAIPLSAIPLSAIDILNSPLSAIPLSAIDIENSPLSAIPLSAIGGVCNPGGLVDCSASLETLGDVISAFGSISSSPLSAIPLSAIPLSAIPADAPLSAIPLSAIPLSAIPLSAIDLSAAPLSAIPLSAIGGACSLVDCSTLTTLADVVASYGSVDASPLSAIPLSAIAPSELPLSAIPLSAIDFTLASGLASTPLSAIEWQSAPLSAIPLSAIPLSAIDCGIVDCSDPTQTLGEIALAGGLSAGATLGDLASAFAAFGDYTLEDLVGSFSLAYLYGAGVIGDPGNNYGTLSLADLLILLLPLDDLPWQDLDPNGLQVYACEYEPGAGCSTDSGITPLHYTVEIAIDGPGAGQETYVDVDLPDDFIYLAGSTTTTGAGLDPVEPGFGEGGPTYLSYSLGSLNPGTYTLEFDALAGFSLGAKEATATVYFGDEDPVGDGASVDVLEIGEPNPDEVRPVEADVLYYGYIATRGDVDEFEKQIPLQAGSTVSVLVGQPNGGASDADLVIYKPANLPPTAFDEGSPLATVPVAADGPGRTVQPETIQDIPTGGGQVAAVSTNRGTGNEQGQVRIDDPTEYAGESIIIQVEAYNESTATASPFSLFIDVDPPAIAPICAAPGWYSDPVTESSYGVPTANASTETLILVNPASMAQAYGAADTDTVMARLATFASRGDVNGVVYPIDRNAAVRTALNNWYRQPCDPNLANAAVKAITAIVDDVRADAPNLRYITIIGGDEMVPMWREPDLVQLSKASSYAPTFDESIGSLYGSLVTNNILTDAAYADLNPIPFLSGHLFVEDFAVGRVVEWPDEIINQIDAFETYNGTLDIDTADTLVTGYDFLYDGSVEVNNDLSAASSGTNTALLDPIIPEGDPIPAGLWTAQDVIDGLNLSPDISSVNAHYDHYRALPSDQDAQNIEADLFTVNDVVALSGSLNGRVYYTMGCNSGVSVSDVAIGTSSPLALDWAQVFAQEGASYVGNTSFGFGDTVTVAYSERLMELFTEQLVAGLPIGEALAVAKNLYYLELGLAAVYDAHVLMEATLYGFPMYSTGGGTPPAGPPPAVVTPDPVTGQPKATASFGGDSFTSETVGSRQYFSLDGRAVTVHDRPIQPISTIPLAPTATGLVPRGAFIENLQISETAGVPIAFGRPVVDLAANEPSNPSDVFFPARVQNVACSNVLGQERCALTMIRGQFRPNGAGEGIGTERLITSADLTVYYADPADPDVTPPTFSSVQATAVAGTFTVSAAITDDSPSTVTRAACHYRLPGAAGWVGLELNQSANGIWSSGASVGTVDPTQVEVFCQAVDHNGNLAVTSFKGVNYQPVAQPDIPGDIGIDLPAAGTGGWYGGDVVISVTGPVGLTYQINGVDQGPVVNGTIVVPASLGTDVHQVTILGGSAPALVYVPIDVDAPTITFITPSEGATFDQGAVVPSEYACADAGAGVDTCVGTVVQGDPIDSSSGSKVFTVTATDLTGKTTVQSVNYTVLPSGDNVCETATPTHTGTNEKDVIYGTSGDDVIFGLGGNDVLWGFGGNDIICGGPGNDRIYAGAGNDQVHGGFGNDRIWAGLQGDDILWGDEGNDKLYGESGTDELHGGSGNDSLWGGVLGDDTLFGDEGNDKLYGQAGNDYLFGGPGNDKLYGGFGNDEISGEEGNDKLYGQWGNDWLDGGANNDFIDGGPGIDTCANGETVKRCEIQ